MKAHSLYVALRKPHVKAHLLGELAALRDSERARTFHRLTALRDQDENKNAAVAAAKTMMQLDTDDAQPGRSAAIRIGMFTIIAPPLTTNSAAALQSEPFTTIEPDSE
jgi:hypothetical protein